MEFTPESHARRDEVAVVKELGERVKETSGLRAGEWVEVRSKEEILATLDQNARLDGLPLMPEMLQHCGKRFKVFKRAHKTCDPPRGMHGRRMFETVHLDGVRCGGEQHGGCQHGCLIFWKEAWLKRVPSGSGVRRTGRLGHNGTRSGCSEAAVLAATVADSEPGKNGVADPTYVCQSTHLAEASHPLRSWDVRQYAEDVTSGNVRVSDLLGALVFFVYSSLLTAGLGFGSAMLWAYDVVQKARGGTPYPWRHGRIPAGMRTPFAKLDLVPNEVVRVKSYPEILATLDETSRNRGMYFDGEMVPFCEGTYRVLGRVERIIDEKTGKMIDLKTDAVILDDVACRACYSKWRKFCPRSIYPFWREIWLERVGGGDRGQEVTRAVAGRRVDLRCGPPGS